ncbi:hypothetical protein BST99_04630 [Aureicoccus marinus]|uniref:Uncharacterized protein n=2 Tax=Aureicoccus marinus TaxID=754435 RepID=A0A2S7T5A3_9FLAO|nr:hypothetical protein BST99_04630 [Aureicoccus marinus]
MIIERKIRKLKIKTMRTKLLLLFLGIATAVSAQRSVYGRVNDGSNPLENVRVVNVNSQAEVETDTKGYYKLVVATGDVLRYELYGFRKVEVVVEDVTRVLNTVLVPEVNTLDEVVVKGEVKSKRSQAGLQERYSEDSSIFLTATGFRDMEAVAGNVDILAEDGINFSYTCILDLMRRFNRVRVFGSCLDPGQNGQVFLNRAIGNSILYPQPVLYDIDGQIFTDTPLWLDPQNIKRLAILNSLNLANTYGTLANGGVILINTKLAALPYAGKDITQEATGSDAVAASYLDKDRPQYLLDVEAASNTNAALGVYEKYKGMYSSSPYFYLDVAKHLWKDRGDRKAVEQVLSEGDALWANNPVLLKGKAFLLDAMGESEAALATYQKIFELRPNYAQSFRDLAQAYTMNKEPKKAAAHYSRYSYVKSEKMMTHKSSDFDTLVMREQKQLLREYGDEIIPDYNKFLNLDEEDFAGTRLVLEWNDGEAEFDLEFVNPQNQTYTWRHSLLDSPEQIEKEKKQGYSSKEFLLDGSLPGVWKMNVKYLGNKSLTPTYFKLTQYSNFGKPNQSEKVSVFKVMTKNVNFELASVVDSGVGTGR